MKKTTIALTLIWVSFCSAVAGVMPVDLATANGFPSPELDFPREPVMTPPTIVVHSPVKDQNYNSTDVWLNFTIIKPEAWIQPAGFYGAVDRNGNKEYDILGNVTPVYYVLDGGECMNISVLDAPSMFDFHPKPMTLNFSITLTLAKGAHTVKVGFEADSYYLHLTDSWNGYISSIAVNGTSEVVNFTVLQEPFPTPFPMLVVAGAVGISAIAIASVGFFYYGKRRKRSI